MRLRNVKNKEEIINNSKYLIKDYEKFLGKWSEFFKNDNPIHLEIGTGRGNFIINSALLNKNINYIGIEKYDSIIARVLTKIPNDLDNLILIRMNALEIDKIFKREIACLYLNFSDPWPKKRQIKHRLTSPKFLEKYDRILKEKAQIIQKTDNLSLFRYSLSTLKEFGYDLVDISLDLHKESLENNILTEYESKFLKQGIKINRVVAVKQNDKQHKKIKN